MNPIVQAAPSSRQNTVNGVSVGGLEVLHQEADRRYAATPAAYGKRLLLQSDGDA
jgi:hypothetical protein